MAGLTINDTKEIVTINVNETTNNTKYTFMDYCPDRFIPSYSVFVFLIFHLRAVRYRLSWP